MATVTGVLSISAILPALDEAENLAGVVSELGDALAEVASAFEIIVVDDGSSDRTGAAAAELAGRDPRIKVVRHEKNRGYGAAVRSGIAAARFDWVFLTDADGQFPFESLKDLVAASAQADVVAGYRAERADPWVRRFNARLWNTTARALLRIPLRDLNCAFKLFRRSLLADLALTVEGPAINAEILLGIMARGGTIHEMPVPHRPRLKGKQTGGRPRVILRGLGELARLSFGPSRSRDRKPGA